MDNRMISVESGFQYSINVRYDVYNPAKMRSYVPTDSFVGLTSDIVESFLSHSTDRARIIVGPYGTGKSHLVTVIASLLRNNLGEQDYERLFDSLSMAGYDDFVPKVEWLLEERPFLTVLVDPGGQEELRQVFIRGLKTSLSEAGLEELMPRTAFKTVEETVKLWQVHYPETFARFLDILRFEFGLPYEEFGQRIRDFDFGVVEVVRSIFPRLTAGVEFDIYNTNDIPALYHDVSKLLQERGYRGIYVFFDEFNKFLEPALHSKELVDLKLLQDFAEMCNRSADAQVHLMLISHQHISQYASTLAEEVVDAWRKVEGRFTSVNLRPSSAKTYQLISAVIRKDPERWRDYVTLHRVDFQRLLERTRDESLFGELSEAELERLVTQGCYPLHPTTVFALPRTCNRLAQNQRTLFTFLATNDFHTLGHFLEGVDQQNFNLLTLDIVFDYFAESATKVRGRDSLGESFLMAREAIAKLGNDPDLMAVKIIKSLAIMIGLEEPGFVPTSELLMFSLVHDDSEKEPFENAFNHLLDRKLIYERRSDGRIHFLTGSDTDFDAAIQAIRGDYRYANVFDVCQILNEFFAPYPIIANRYNDEYEMTRFFYQEFFSADDLVSGFDWTNYLIEKNYADGVVAYVVCENEEQCHAILNYVKGVEHSQVVFICPNDPLQGFSELVYDYYALQLLRKDKGFVEKDPYASAELEAYLADYEEQIDSTLSSLIGHSSLRKSVFNAGEECETPHSRADLSRLISGLCKKVFRRAPKINNELINRTNVTRTVMNARKKVVKAILSEVNEPQLGLKGYGPDVSIFRSLIRRPRIYREAEGRVELVLDRAVEPEFLEVIMHIQDSVTTADMEPLSFAKLFDDLRVEPYGLRLGVLPVFLAMAFRGLKKALLVRDQNGIEQPLDEELIEAITRNPIHYSVETIDLDSAKERYVDGLASIFEPYLPEERASYNYAYPIGIAMKRWFVNLPKYTRDSRMHSEATRKLGRYLSIPMADSAELLFRRIPNLTTNAEEFRVKEVEAYLEQVKNIKEELETHLIVVKTQLEESIKQHFDAPGLNRTLATIVRTWYADLSEGTKAYAFSGTAYKLLRLAQLLNEGDEVPVLSELITMMVGLDLADWSDDIRDKFDSELEKTIRTIVDVERESVAPANHQRVSFVDETGEISERLYTKVEIGSLGQILHSELASALDGFADAISLDEKRQVLLELLKGIS